MSTNEVEAAQCHWQQDDEGAYDTGCDERFEFYCDGPIENGFRFCPYCGKPIEV